MTSVSEKVKRLRRLSIVTGVAVWVLPIVGGVIVGEGRDRAPDFPVHIVGISVVVGAIVFAMVHGAFRRSVEEAIAELPVAIAVIREYELLSPSNMRLVLSVHTASGDEPHTIEIEGLSGVQSRYVKQGGRLAVQLPPEPLKVRIDWNKTQKYFGDEEMVVAGGVPRLLECPRCAAVLEPSDATNRQIACEYCGAVSVY